MSLVRAALYDIGMHFARRQLDPRRRALVASSKGRVLEIGIGTGQNLPFYTAAAQVMGADPDWAMLERARRRTGTSPSRVRLVVAVGEALPFRDGSLEEVIATLVF